MHTEALSVLLAIQYLFHISRTSHARVAGFWLDDGCPKEAFVSQGLSQIVRTMARRTGENVSASGISKRRRET